MRGLSKAAALLLAPALARASFLSLHDSKPDTRTPLAVVDFDVLTGRHGIESLALKVDVEESEDICGETDLSINGKKLTYNEHGSGSGDVRVGDKTVTAHWLLSCVMTHTEPEAQLLRFSIDKINGHSVDTSELLLTFRKTSPALVLDFHGALEKSGKGKGKTHHGQHDGEMPNTGDELEAQLQELELLRAQAVELMELIHEKEMAINERFGGRGGDYRRPPPPPPGFSSLRDCDSIQCVVRTLTEKVKHTAGNLCPEWLHDGHGHGHGWGHEGGHHPHGPPKHKFPGNHSHPVPPHHRPPFCPPCHGPPPPHHGERPHPPEDEQPFPPPDHDAPPPPPPENGDEPSDELPPPPPPPPGHGPPPPPPPPEDEEHGHRHGEHDHDFPPMESKDREDRAHRPHHGDHPPHPHGHGPHGHGPHGPPHNPVVMTFGMAAIALALFSVIGIGYIHRRINRLTPESRRAIRRAIRRSDSNRRSRRNGCPRSAIQRILARWTGDCDEEKESMLRSRSDSEDSVTMEQEIARFREAAFMVEGLVAAEEGRNPHRMHPHYCHHPPPPPPPPHPHHPHHQHPHGPPPPPPPPPRPPMIPEHVEETAYPGFVPTEPLPSYDDETRDSSVVSDGCRYTPGSSDYTPSESGANTNDVLGDTKKN